jgi:hypothetical protein
MRKTLTTGLLLLAFSCPTLAGEMLTPPAPTPPQSASAIQEPTGGEMPNGYMQTGIMPNDAPSGLTQIALELLAILPSVL